jgi:hypothetical protein
MVNGRNKDFLVTGGPSRDQNIHFIYIWVGLGPTLNSFPTKLDFSRPTQFHTIHSEFAHLTRSFAQSRAAGLNKKKPIKQDKNSSPYKNKKKFS